jgi:mono/diheme cytochrome c family protein
MAGMSMHTEQRPGSLRMALICMAFILPFSVYAVDATGDQLKRGKQVYKQSCQSCHGDNLQGQNNWRKRKPDGKLPAPPHDETGHTWHHADTLLFGIIKFGLVPPYAPANYKNDMPSYGSVLDDNDIHAVIAFIKSRWPEETQIIQKEINNEGLQLLSK